MKSQDFEARRKPAGGFAFISVVQLCAAWTAYRERTIRLVDLRTWFACWEIVARRCQLERKRAARFEVGEVSRLVGGVGGEHTRASIRRLMAAGLLIWTPNELLFPKEFPAQLAGTASGMLGQIVNHRRRVPVPRRILRFIASDAGRVTIATIVGHLLRCLYYRDGSCQPAGTCKASWIASTFSVDRRNVKEARRQLASMGWLSIGDAPQWRLNRFGAVVRINLDWSPKGNVLSGLPSPNRLSTTNSPLPESDRELLSEYKNQKPAPSGKDGFCRSKGNAKKGEMRPRLERIIPPDLQSTSRLEVLFEQAKRQGFVREGEASWLAFVAAAEHARSIGRANPCGLFSAIIRRQLWHFVSQQAEDVARLRARSFATRGFGSYQPMYHSQAPKTAALRAVRINDIVQQVFTSIRSEDGKSGSWNQDATSKTLAKAAAQSATIRSGPENISTSRESGPTPIANSIRRLSRQVERGEPDWQNGLRATRRCA